ncbi:MAG: hypothetical protein LBT01_00715, partial [Spirochaetaceae bacterium]|nr:hypothetical protein [Spirochaetaceae bacterium]
MRVAFYANLEFGKNTGSLSLPMDGSLSGAKNSGVIPLKITCSGGTGGYIFYANIADEQHPLDVIRFLENSFGCDLPNFELEINGAGFFIFFADDSKSAINDIFPETQNFMPVSISENANVKNAVCFWITADIHAGLFNNLIKIGGKNEDGKLALLAVFSGETTGKTAFENAEFMAKLPTFELLKIFEFSEVVFKYTFGKAKSFWINGKVCVHLFGNEFGFMVTATVDEERLFVESVMNNDKHLSLFGGAMAGITFTELYLNITHVFETEKSDSSTEILVKASASFGGVSCSGALYLSGGTPALAQISLGEEEDFSFANFFNSVTGANLPSDVFDLSFKCGSSLYYNNSGG